MPKVNDLTGQRFGKLEVISFVGIINHRAVFKCKCDCGNEKNIKGDLLNRGRTRSCGCLAVNNIDRTTHGLSKTHLYGVWNTMKSRCFNPNSQHYKLYGQRGITVCEEWKEDYLAFHKWAMENGYDSKLTLDRIDVNGNYEPSNCRWTDMKQQSNNRQDNVFITYKGKTQTLHQWADELEIKYTTLWMRLFSYKWSVEKAFERR